MSAEPEDAAPAPAGHAPDADAAKAVALYTSPAPAARGRRQQAASDSDSDDERTGAPQGSPGPPDPRRCTVSGPGFTGGHAGSAVSLYVTLKDEYGRRLKGGEEGGADGEDRSARGAVREFGGEAPSRGE